MQLTKISIKKNKQAKRQVKALYTSAFPKYERLPWSVLRLAACEKHSSIDAYFDGDTFCGFTFSTVTDKVCFIMFFAVESTLRGKGYGSAILSKIKDDYSGIPIVLNIEPLEESAPNLDERKSRLAFYEKNGFYDTGYLVREVGGVFTVLSTEKTLDEHAYKKVFKALTLGLWNVKLWKNKR